MAGAIQITIVGLQTLKARLGAARAKAALEMAAALYVEANSIFNESQRLVPVDTGVLRGSGHVSPPEYDAGGISVTIGYGGPAAPYAIYVHEITDSYHRPPTQAKFLEQPFLAAAATMEQRLAHDLELSFQTTI